MANLNAVAQPSASPVPATPLVTANTPATTSSATTSSTSDWPFVDPSSIDWSDPWVLAGGAMAVVGAAASGYHGHQRHDGSVGWTVAWSLFGLLAPYIAVPVSLIQGYAQPSDSVCLRHVQGTLDRLAPEIEAHILAGRQHSTESRANHSRTHQMLGQLLPAALLPEPATA
jgi:hypothetical protein